jgi:hypothetical protein
VILYSERAIKAVRITHKQTGIVCEANCHRSKYHNRNAARLMLESRIAAQPLDPGPMPIVREYTDDDVLDWA